MDVDCEVEGSNLGLGLSFEAMETQEKRSFQEKRCMQRRVAPQYISSELRMRLGSPSKADLYRLVKLTIQRMKKEGFEHSTS